MGWSYLLEETALEDANARKAIAAIGRNTQALTRLIADLLDMSRIITGQLRLDVRRVDLPAVIAAAVEAVKPSADANRIQQVLWNLLSNAIKFTPRGGRVTVALRRVQSQLAISVSDDGKGIGPEFLPYVFDRFRQADASITRQYGGLGLGLSIVKHLVELHGGTVTASSAGDGQGTTFVVNLPIVAVFDDAAASFGDPRAGPRAVSADGAEPLLIGVRVLVVDDDPDSRALLARVLSDRRAEVTTADSAAEALRLIGAHRYHVIVSDIGMPEQDGYEFMRKARGAGNAARTPAVALTAFARPEDRQRALDAGYQVHVPKPVEPAELVAIVGNLARLM